MAYNANTPQATDIIANTQKPILDNFGYINTSMQVNHTFNGNGIGAEAAGSHQRLDMPNQGADITGALPAGIADVMYAIGGSLYAWDGTAKRPVSGMAGTATGIPKTPPGLAVANLPNDCIGFALIPGQPAIPTMQNQILTGCCVFYIISGSSVLINLITVPTTTQRPNFSITGGVLRVLNIDYNQSVTAKYIYWPI